MSVQVPYWKQIIFIVVFLAVILFAVEGISRIYNYYEPNCTFMKSDLYKNMDFSIKRSICVDNENLKYTEDPYFHLSPNQHLATINVDSDGFRGPELNKDNSRNVYKIFVVGGSTTFGVGTASDNTTFPGYLQSLFDSLGNKNIEVINAGIDDGYSYTETSLIKNKIIQDNPNLIIIYDGWNDLKRPLYGYSENVRYDLFSIIRQDIVQTDFVAPKVLAKLDRSWAQSFNYTTEPFDEKGIDQKTSIWKERWSDICQLGKQDNFDTVIILQPFAGTGHKKLTSEEKKFYITYDARKMSQYYPSYINALKDLNGTCTKVADFRDIFDNMNETIYLDGTHTSNSGNNIIAHRVFELVSSLMH